MHKETPLESPYIPRLAHCRESYWQAIQYIWSLWTRDIDDFVRFWSTEGDLVDQKAHCVRVEDYE